MEVPRAARSGVYVDRAAPKFDRQLGCAAVELAVQFQSDWEKSETLILRPQDPTKYHSRTTVRPTNEGPDLFFVKMSATTTKLKWRQNYHVTSAILHFIICFHIPVGVPQCVQLCSEWGYCGIWDMRIVESVALFYSIKHLN